jgi:iron complex outermembrane receptor protein
VPLPSAADDPAPPDPPVVEAPEVTISSTRTERNVLDVAGNVTTIDRAQIERSGARSVPDLLRREAGLMVTSLGTTPEGYTVEARGFNNGGGNGCSTLVLVDGRRINEPETGCPDWSFVALEDIERIEIVRGPASVAYGDNAAAGVIQIFTYRPREDGVRMGAAYDFGSYGTENTGVRLSGRQDGVFATAYVGDNDSNGYRHQSDFDDDWDDLRLGIGADLAEAGELRLDGGYDSNDRQRPGTLTELEMEDDRRQADPGSLGDFDRARARFLAATLDVRPVEDVRVRVIPYVRRRTDDGRLSGDDGAGGTFDFFTDTVTEQYGADGQIEVGFDALGQRHTFLVGGEARREDSDVKNLFTSLAFGDTDTNVRLRRETWGAFVQQEIGLRDDLHLLLGVRRDEIHYSGSGFQDSGGFITEVEIDEDPDVWSPRASLTWRVTEPIGLYVGYARGFRSANVNEEVSLFGVDPLDPQKTESYEIGGKYRAGDCALNLALYWMNVKDEILFDPTTFANTNLDRVRHRGVELSGTVRPVGWLELYASYTFDDVRIRDGIADAGRIPITPENRGAAGGTIFLPLGFEIGADWLYVGSRPLANDLDNDSAALPSYWALDARVAWRHTHGPFGFAVEAIGRNLNDREYEEFGGEATFGGPPGFFPSPESNYVVGARLEYRR